MGLSQHRYTALDCYIRNILANVMTKAEIAWSFDAWCERPVVHHATYLSAANHHDRKLGRIDKTNDPAVVAHKIQAIRALQKDLSQLETSDCTSILKAMTPLMKFEPSEDELRPDEGLLFSPHVPTLNNMDVYGRGRLAQTNEDHRQAIRAILIRADGLRGLKSTGLAKGTCAYGVVEKGPLLVRNADSSKCSRQALLLASRCLLPPRLENFWKSESLTSFVMVSPMLPQQRALGFFNIDPPEALTDDLLSTLNYLSAIEEIASRSRGQQMDDHVADQLRSAINDAHHRLMSLPARQDVYQDAQGCSAGAVYETVRLTAILYSLAILFPVPVASGWHIELFSRLRGLVEQAVGEGWHRHNIQLMIWVLCLAAIAAYRTQHRDFFEKQLRSLLLDCGITKWEDVQCIVRQFLWSDEACSQGVLVL